MKLVALVALLLGLQEAPRQEDPDPFKGLWKPVGLDLKNVPTREAFKTLFQESGVELELPGRLEAEISLKIQNAPFWRAFDEICQANGNLRIPRGIADGDRNWIESGPWIPSPVLYQGPLRLHVRDVARIREFRYPGRRDRTDVVMILSWVPDLIPVRDDMFKPGDIHLTRAEDDTGKSLLPMVLLPGSWDTSDYYDFSNTIQLDHQVCAWFLRLQPSAAGASKIIRLEGQWEGSFLSDLEELRFEKLAKAEGQSRKAGPVVVTLTRFGRERDPLLGPDTVSYDLTLKLSIDPGATEECKEALKRSPLAHRLLREAHCRTPVGNKIRVTPVDFRPVGGSDPAAPELRSRIGILPYEPEILVVKVGKDLRSGKFPFSFRDVRLPERDR